MKLKKERKKVFFHICICNKLYTSSIFFFKYNMSLKKKISIKPIHLMVGSKKEKKKKKKEKNPLKAYLNQIKLKKNF